MTAFNSKAGGFQLTTVGRVQTPTLAILVEREEKIRAFRPRDYWEVHGTFRADGRRIRRAAGSTRSSRRATTIPTRAPSACGTRRRRARDRRKAATASRAMVTEEAKPSTQVAPLLYDLTSLQREANGRFGFSARTTLSLAQALYEKHKVLTYPRTDSRALPEDYLDTVKETMEALDETERLRRASPTQILKQKWVKPNKRIFDNSKISDHFAIIPTLVHAEASERARGEALRLGRASASSRCSIRRRSSW